jgi:hypothetical protein
LGQYIDINKITNHILSLNDVADVKTYNTITKEYTDGISLLAWNYFYPNNDKKVYNQNVTLENFKFPVFNNIDNIQDSIIFYKDPSEVEATQF